MLSIALAGKYSSQRIRVEATADHASTPLNDLQYYAMNHGDEISKVTNMFRMFLVTYQGDNLIDFGNLETVWQQDLAYYSRSAPLAGGLALALEQAYPPYYERPPEERLRFASWTLIKRDERAPDVEIFRLAITKDSIDPHCFHILHGFNLTRVIIESMVNCIYLNDETAMSGWCSMLTEAVWANVDLHDVNGSEKTVLDIFLDLWEEYLDDHGEGLRETKLNAAVRRFLGALQDSGVDLLSYGTKWSEVAEERLHDYCQSAGVDFTEPFQGRYLILEWGSSVDDWHVYIRYWPHFSYVEDFWYMVENPWERIPGAWVE